MRTLAALVSLLLLPPTLALAAPQAGKRTLLEFESRLADDEGKPVSGIFSMQFELRRPQAKAAFWKEKHWVAIDNGRYQLQLGRDARLPAAFDPKTAVITVSVAGVGRILEEPLAGAGAGLSQIDESAAGSNKRIVRYAEKAGFAYESERASTAERVGPYDATRLQETFTRLEQRKVKVKISRNRVNLSSVGGAGGTPFEMVCPPGTVMVGIRGGAGIYIDNLQVVCAPLE
jgi:hypothetical protein